MNVAMVYQERKAGFAARNAAIAGEMSSTFSAHPSWIPCASKTPFAGSVLNAMLENRLQVLTYTALFGKIHLKL